MFQTIKVKKINEHVYLMDDNHETTGYLIVGTKKAIMFDAMYGSENVMEIIRTITDLPVMLINSHGHCDHIYGDVYFDKAFINKIDYPIVLEHSKMPEFINVYESKGLKLPPFEFIEGGEIIDLGEIEVETIHFAGHTQGGTMLLLRADRMLFVGDAINHHMWMQLPESSPMDKFVKDLEKLMYIKKEADYLLHAHATEVDDITLLDKVLKGAKDIVAGNTKEDKTYEWFGGKCMQHQYDEDGSIICYKPF